MQKIVEGIDWEDIGIRRVFTADNIRQARKIFETFPVDILVTDIELPQGNGLELLEWVKQKNYPAESLVLSGYAHFAYAQKAMQYGTKEYMLKPISNRELSEKVRNIVFEKRNRTPLLRKKSSRFDDWKGAVENGRLYIPSRVRLNLGPDEVFCIEILRNLSDTGRNDTDRYLLDFVVKNMVQEFYENRGLELEYAGRIRDDEWIVIFRENGCFPLIGKYTTQMQESLLEAARLNFCVYLGRSCALDDLPGSYQVLQQIVGEAVPDNELFFREADWNQSQKNARKLPDFRSLERIMEDDILKVKEILMDYIQDLSESHSATRSGFQELMDGIMPMIDRNLLNRSILRARIFDEQEFEEGYRNAFLSVNGMREWIAYLFDKLDGYQYSSRKQEYLVEKLKKYIEDHLDGDLSRKELAKIAYLSEDYLSKIFSAETGSSIPNYVTGQRILRAQRYLRETDMTVSQIGMKVGYSNFSYFSKNFRDITGKTPNEYRNSIKKKLS